MLNRENRLHYKRDFKEVFNRGKVFKTDFFSVYYLDNNLEKIRAAVIVKKKYFIRAVIRSYHKRILKSLVRMFLFNLCYDFIVVVTKSSGNYDEYYKSMKLFSDYLSCNHEK